MKTLSLHIALVLIALLMSAPTQAGYTDGMNQYSAYHVMHGGMDP